VQPPPRKSAAPAATTPKAAKGAANPDPLDFGSLIKIPDLPDTKTCTIDGPFWPDGVSTFGAECAKDDAVGCFEVAQALYQAGRWACARVYHVEACKLDAHRTAPPPGGGDYAFAGWPQCPVDKEGRAAWKDRELEDPVKKSCYVDHVAKACTQLAEKSKDAGEQDVLRRLAAAWR
jgi:hypothetical protein